MKLNQHLQPFFLLVIALLFLSSCAIYNGNITGNAALSNAQFKHVGTVSATRTCVYVFHWGGVAKRSQITALKQDLQRRYPLRNGLAWANVSVEMKTGFWGLFDTRKATLTADIIDFWPDTNTVYAAYNGYYLNDSTFICVPQKIALQPIIKQESLVKRLQLLSASKNNSNISSLVSFEFITPEINEAVILKYRGQYTYGIITALKEYDAVNVAYLNENGKLKIRGISKRFLFK